ncbi:hypothetical protein NEOLEDRAFT_1144958 [Neolentinus lepideus HHB14362 ss-1]|uniref:Uncharacterized protein n=1 Tax=Neolentinus lepideus HHB14362 ss-1 TaxID=1314782 RepID=A0A165VMJ3_9AGAM|nr:hypothetical protein NEOLEDRAFT_1144958 [Neolentinus lepideus HHB14362 ss-1]
MVTTNDKPIGKRSVCRQLIQGVNVQTLKTGWCPVAQCGFSFAVHEAMDFGILSSAVSLISQGKNAVDEVDANFGDSEDLCQEVVALWDRIDTLIQRCDKQAVKPELRQRLVELQDEVDPLLSKCRQILQWKERRGASVQIILRFQGAKLKRAIKEVRTRLNGLLELYRLEETVSSGMNQDEQIRLLQDLNHTLTDVLLEIKTNRSSNDHDMIPPYLLPPSINIASSSSSHLSEDRATQMAQQILLVDVDQTSNDRHNVNPPRKPSSAQDNRTGSTKITAKTDHRNTGPPEGSGTRKYQDKNTKPAMPKAVFKRGGGKEAARKTVDVKKSTGSGATTGDMASPKEVSKPTGAIKAAAAKKVSAQITEEHKEHAKDNQNKGEIQPNDSGSERRDGWKREAQGSAPWPKEAEKDTKTMSRKPERALSERQPKKQEGQDPAMPTTSIQTTDMPTPTMPRGRGRGGRGEGRSGNRGGGNGQRGRGGGRGRGRSA